MLRGINLGATRRVPMAELRALLSEAGYQDVATYVQSGNIVLSADAPTAELEAAVSALVSERFGFEAPVVGRSAEELVAVLAHDPIPTAAEQPKLYQVTFLAEPASPAAARRLEDLAATGERVVAHGRELYTFHPGGIARSKLALSLTAKQLGVSATARNWRTVTTLAEMATQPSA